MGGLHLNLGQAFHQSAAAFRMCPVTTTKAFFHAIVYSLNVACIQHRHNRQNIFLYDCNNKSIKMFFDVCWPEFNILIVLRASGLVKCEMQVLGFRAGSL